MICSILIVYSNKCLNEKRRRNQENLFIDELAELISATDMSSGKTDKCQILQRTVDQVRRQICTFLPFKWPIDKLNSESFEIRSTNVLCNRGIRFLSPREKKKNKRKSLFKYYIFHYLHLDLSLSFLLFIANTDFLFPFFLRSSSFCSLIILLD